MFEDFIYPFTFGDRTQSDLLGGKGANLAEMVRIGLPVPPGFTITTHACREYLSTNTVPEGLTEQIEKALVDLEKSLGKKFGDAANPLLVSVRSGAKFSMPGMMETVLNVGMTPEVAESMAIQTGNPRFAWDSYRRFIDMYGRIVCDISPDEFHKTESRVLSSFGISSIQELDVMGLQALADGYIKTTEAVTGLPFPTNPVDHLMRSIEAVFRSWNSERAQLYRRRERIPSDLGTAVNIQSMVFGNLSDDSGTGVAFTRDPATGEKGSYGDYLERAQGEDVVAGIRNTISLVEFGEKSPVVHAELERVMTLLEDHYRDLCDIEFTVEKGKLWILQTRVGKRTAEAAFRIATQLVDEGKISMDEALVRTSGDQLAQLMFPQFDLAGSVTAIATGIPASPGAAVGEVVFDSRRAFDLARSGKKVILVRRETSPDDLVGMVASEGILTSRGGKTSHAAVVARGMGKTAVCGTESISVDERASLFTVGSLTVYEGEIISIDGSTGNVYMGVIPVIASPVTSYLEGRLSAASDEASPVVKAVDRILSYADEIRTLRVRTNADTPEDAVRARILGAEGVGLCRTEHMFLGPRRSYVERLVLAENEDVQRGVIAEMEPLQRGDFVGIMMAMSGLPVTVRLLDPPLHEFLPPLAALSSEMARAEALGEEVPPRDLAIFAAVKRLHEANPMLGLRGVRLGILIPELYKMQVRALVHAYLEVKRLGHDPKPEVMIPLVATQRELLYLRETLEDEIKKTFIGTGQKLDIPIGTMIETPRAAITASRLGQYADFFSFGTNDLTQLTWAFSRDDVESTFLPRYLDLELLPFNPFESLDQAGVGILVRTATEQARSLRPDFKLGVCGEHGGDPRSIHFFHELGLDYVSCSPFRVPVARLEAGRALVLKSASGSSV
ncbi:MAG: pyruvate, phosphate dikinase [Actinobacteria bacterium]|uniref:pyruvate, phosphate dikinase n=1 Tax=freshwater metagenome TaxID=449393 RepID=A0A6J7D389_9ZZZZ|nr:pyruvate, phosphate dikinase [Actinomycetota bacterium]MSX24829.1 pyruvate, phosphate dikinase [Actinomycetota bacterium]MSY46909.1 pyruvate, phosphate dikinase [Actinomycetota bacterium]MSY56763.1 pyruvate, phosphate dikinase [Actinomycetota bacterium]MTB00438.1 pyruvate, phosphate dikinase [Actinomycetota bacterium]